MFDGVVRPPVVLAYHGVADPVRASDPHRLLTAPALLDSQLRYLRRCGYTISRADDVVGEHRPPVGTAVVTFDDGWHDALTRAVPVLARHDASATFFVCCGWLGGQHPEVDGDNGRLLSRTDICELLQHGMTVGSHSMTHRDLRGLDDVELRKELCESKAVLEDVTGFPCRLFAYPFGLFDARVQRAVEAAGYDAAFAWSPGPWRRYAVPRMPAPPRHGPSRLALKLQLRIRRRI